MLELQSFAYTRGIPVSVNCIFDVRHLPDPYFLENLRSLNGLNLAVQDFFSQRTEVQGMIESIYKQISLRLALADQDNDQKCLHVAIGCVGGQHRSVYAVEALAMRFNDKCNVTILHRDLII